MHGIMLRVPDDMLAKIDARAEAEGKTRPEVIRDAVEKHVK